MCTEHTECSRGEVKLGVTSLMKGWLVRYCLDNFPSFERRIALNHTYKTAVDVLIATSTVLTVSPFYAGFCLVDVEWWSKFNLRDTSILAKQTFSRIKNTVNRDKH